MKKNVLIVAFITLLIDLLTKYFVFSVNKLIVVIKNFFVIEPVKNSGAAFSMFDNMNFFLIFVSIVVLIYLLRYIKYAEVTKLDFISYGLIIGGLLGNLYDRLVFGYVRDFLSFSFGAFDFAIFNVADMAIVIGVIIYIFLILSRRKKAAWK